MEPRLLQLDQHEDYRGLLTVANDLPFDVRRMFFFGANEKSVRRGGHAHRVCHQLLVPIRGCVRVELDKEIEKPYHLGGNIRGGQALHVTPMTWLEIELYPGATLAVLCSHPYDEEDYIREWHDFYEAVV